MTSTFITRTSTLLWIFICLTMTTTALAAVDSGQNPNPFILGDCQVGNLNPPVGPPVPDLFFGEEAYAYHVKPIDQCTSTEDGFILESVTQMLHFNTDQIPAVLIVKAALYSAQFDTPSGCWMPGITLYESMEETFTIADNGILNIQVPIASGPAYLLNDHYFLVMSYQGGAMAQLVVDDEPMPCTEFVNRGNGWQDLNGRDKSGGGKVIIFGDIVFSPASVANTQSTWDGIKSLYK
ncbi:MAG: hypothetical protein GY780_14260 [bacterium]|nr:hypothetical protein [bacterium]